MKKFLKFGLIFLAIYIVVTLVGVAGSNLLRGPVGFFLGVTTTLVNFLDFFVFPILSHCQMGQWGGCQNIPFTGFLSAIFYFLIGCIIGGFTENVDKKKLAIYITVIISLSLLVWIIFFMLRGLGYI